jgi:serine phosphatase RsbU (regulator of sigma subunit)/ligand-binding sensor domain-containing protein
VRLGFLAIALLIQTSVDAAEVVRAWSIVRKEQGMMVNYVSSVAEAPDGSVWFGTAAGVSRFDGRTWKHYTTKEGLPGFLVTHVHVDPNGDVWAASGDGYPTFTQHWLARLRNGNWEEFELPGQRTSVRQFLSVKGHLYAATPRGVLHIEEGRHTLLTEEDGLSGNNVSCMVAYPDGSILAMHSGRGRRRRPVERGHAGVSLRLHDQTDWTTHPLSVDLQGITVLAVARDPDGGLWFGTSDQGIRVYADETWRSIMVEDGLPSNTIDVLTITETGEVWAGSPAGVGLLTSYKDSKWRLFSERDVLPSDAIQAIVSMSDGSVWVGTRAGAARYSATGWVHHTGPFAEARGPVAVELSLDGDLWAGTQMGLYNFHGGEWHLSHAFDRPSAIFDLAAANDGTMWALTPQSILHLQAGKWETVNVPRPTLDPRSRFLAIASRRAGGCWLGGRGIYRFDGGKVERVDVDIESPVREIFEQSDGTLWIGGLWDLFRYRDGKLTKVDAVESYGLGGPEAIIETSTGDLWVSFLSGVWRLRDDVWSQLPEDQSTGFEGTTSMFESSRGTIWLASRIEGAIHTDGKTWTRYGAKSGLPSSTVWDVTEDAEGNLWFATSTGLGCYRPDTSPPETELTDAPVKVAPLEPVYMRLGGRDSWLGTPTEELQFSWRIDGSDWSAYSRENRLLLDRLPAGIHRFEVRSLDRQFNVDPTPAAVTFEVLAPVIFRPWFVGLSVVSLLAIVLSTGAAIHRSRRLKQTQQQLIDDLEAELQEAHDMQMSLLPSGPIESDRIQADGRCVPANHVGGDYYSFDWMEAGETFVIGAADVSGKAMKAAVRVMQLSGMYRYELRPDRSPKQVLNGLHWSLLDHLDDRSFVTGCLASMDAETGKVQIANGGHPYPIVLTAAAELREIEMPSMPLGMTLPFGVTHNLAEEEIALDDGDTLVFYSDGITDLQDEDEEFYGEERFFASLKRLAGMEPTKLVGALMDEVGQFKGTAPQADDVTIVAVMWREAGPNDR